MPAITADACSLVGQRAEELLEFEAQHLLQDLSEELLSELNEVKA